jgi:hypothetical protein
LGWRCGVRRGRSPSKVCEEEQRTVEGTRDSFSMVIRRPRWEVSDTRVWNAAWSSWEAGGR